MQRHGLLQVRSILKYVAELERRSSERLDLVPATVVRVQKLGMGDRYVIKRLGSHQDHQVCRPAFVHSIIFKHAPPLVEPQGLDS